MGLHVYDPYIGKTVNFKESQIVEYVFYNDLINCKQNRIVYHTFFHSKQIDDFVSRVIEIHKETQGLRLFVHMGFFKDSFPNVTAAIKTYDASAPKYLGLGIISKDISYAVEPKFSIPFLMFQEAP